MTPLESYNHHLLTQAYQADPQQKQAILALQRVYEELMSQNKQTLLQRLFRKRKRTTKGVYLWGGVGIGKTWLMDIFYQNLPIPNKMRLHFHRFMQQIHQQLKELQGHADPLPLVAQQLAKQAKVICFDEFLVTDIVDAMILANLFRALFAEGIVLITTANTPPDELYRNGISREYFVPAITLIKQHVDVIHLTTEYDYRRRELEQAGAYYCPLNATAERFMQQHFKQLTRINYSQADQTPLMIEGREIAVIAKARQVAWFSFNVLCHVPRSQVDYIEIAHRFHTVLLSDVPKIEAQQDNLARYLINLVDVFYDARIKLIISAAVPIQELYTQGRLAFEFKRTQSRLLEMQSKEYLSLPPFGKIIE